MKITILGCGSSAGVPLVTGEWGDCNPNVWQNHRTRSSIALHTERQTWLIDTSPDLRYQCLREQITQVDGVLYTHGHFDHIGGLDDLKPFSLHQKKPIKIWGDALTIHGLRLRYPYAFLDTNLDSPSVYQPFMEETIIEGPFDVDDVPVIPFIQDHRYSTTLGFRFPTWAYSTDVWHLDDTAFEMIAGIELWIVDCLAPLPQRTHSHLERTLNWIERVNPKRAILTHMGHFMDYATLLAELPSHVFPAFDGMQLEV